MLFQFAPAIQAGINSGIYEIRCVNRTVRIVAPLRHLACRVKPNCGVALTTTTNYEVFIITINLLKLSNLWSADFPAPLLNQDIDYFSGLTLKSSELQVSHF